MLSISEKLEIVLKREGVTKKELADKLGTSQPNVSKKFKYNDWRESDIKEICRAIGIESETVFKLSDGTIV
ncbi:helix-turn-helix domain-containing protein [Lactonifactor sp. BIOML-A3]|uniref:helix-turn-helix domain-containing protein n=1 Tax=unclassified Lactonifactor TaxID=2636670 RepID=UPI0012AFB9A9|nr:MULTISPECIES: helix-turn-helix domain-containing protein [unclassified Lactonifactor]MSA02187.1 helix-turn-helix domain-containing protein [Lactonifactor sp. BIOML-A5]MSA07972.1 helix-turn-helix domain-containing protein [Lactonifactor sp. BIOML-A4]MSA12588.1 helix-turn-helix domain-containing protein [Lactonifactor sp. BIOML-A3]MSA16711.1 helix-turn-helix domain-containing protein [Lactonifactor sp. BIOML-A2]MSA37590.1 helix-turn-helix domain-containing protein [Lactonifactor sp. BIOML-A1]